MKIIPRKNKINSSPLILENRQKKIIIPINLLLKRGAYFMAQLAAKKKHRLKKTTEVYFGFVDDREIKKWHKDYFNDPTATDVISFPLRGKSMPHEGDRLGDVLISVETAKRQSKVYGSKLNEELTLYMIHGVLHLLGYDDLAPSKKKVMEKLQFDLLKKVLKQQPYSKGK